MSDKRLVRRLNKYWSFLRDKSQQELPMIGKFDNRMISDIQPLCCEVKVIASASDNTRYQFIKVGRKIVEFFGYDPTLKTISSDFSALPGGEIIEDINTAIQNDNYAEPIIREGEVTHNGRILKYRACALPFANSIGGGLTDVIIGTSWGDFGEV